MNINNPNFTPSEGEWIADPDVNFTSIRIKDTGRTIATIKHCPSHLEYMSNARLIMHSKRMLQALTMALAYHDQNPDGKTDILYNSIRTLIRQIDGLPLVEEK